ncbi:hypothetical protein AIF0345_2530 [Actinomyces israelii]|nr:hypothetical protein AIF0345_2530 [Actinomyces israelii]
MSVSTPPEPRSYDPRSGAPRPAERTSILRRTDGVPEGSASPDPADSMPTQALPTDWSGGQPATSVMPTGAGDWSGEQPATSVMPTGAGDWSGEQPATSVMPTGADEWADSRPTTVAPAYAPAPSVQTPGAPAQWNEPATQPAPEPRSERRSRRQPEPESEVLPPNRSLRRRTAALPIGTVLLVASVVLLGWGVYTFLTSLRVFDIVLGKSDIVNMPAAIAVGAGALLAFFAFVAALVACARARPKTAAIMLLLGSLVLPLGSTAAAAYFGGTQLKDQTLAEAQQMKGKVDISQVTGILDQFKSMGVNVPWRDDLLRILQGADGTGIGQGGQGGQGGTGQDGSGTTGDGDGGNNDGGAGSGGYDGGGNGAGNDNGGDAGDGDGAGNNDSGGNAGDGDGGDGNG